MTTLTTIVWLFAVFLAVQFAVRVVQAGKTRGGQARNKVLAWFLLWLMLSFGVTSALLYDIFDIPFLSGDDTAGAFLWWFSYLVYGDESFLNPDFTARASRVTVLLISGLVAMGTIAVFSIVRSYLVHGDSSVGRPTFSVWLRFAAEVIGLIGSILGILGFYLQFVA